MIDVLVFVLKLFRKLFRKNRNDPFSWLTDSYCQYKDQDANDYILNRLNSYQGGGLMLAKWGTIELNQVIATYMASKGYSINDYKEMIQGVVPIPENKPNFSLYNNAGVFPATVEIANRFARKAMEDCKSIDILASYMHNEHRIAELQKNATCVNLNPYYAPWLFENPWTKWLEGKRVLVVHPFVESIRHQYENNRTKLFKNPEVLPLFSNIQYVKAVQTQAGEQTQFKDWFEALNYMEQEIDKKDYDVAIIGCGAYGMSLAAHVKRRGKVAIHLAGWTQMLFGVYGERWVSQQSRYKDVINEFWIRPNQGENLKKGKQIENGCYW